MPLLNIEKFGSDNIFLTSETEKPSLEDLLAGSPEEKIQIIAEDFEWLDAVLVGNEID